MPRTRGPGGIDELVLEPLLHIFYDFLNETDRLVLEGRDFCCALPNEADVITAARSPKVSAQTVEGVNYIRVRQNDHRAAA